MEWAQAVRYPLFVRETAMLFFQYIEETSIKPATYNIGCGGKVMNLMVAP